MEYTNNNNISYSKSEAKYPTEKVSYVSSIYKKSNPIEENRQISWAIVQTAKYTGHTPLLHDGINFSINKDTILKIPYSTKFLCDVFNKALYILNLEEDWDEEGAEGYSVTSWKCAAKFLINFYEWLNVNTKGSLHIPKMNHGPNGSIDISWNENNFRLFINIDKGKDIGTYYADSPNCQYSEGEFPLNNIKYHMLPVPYKF